MIWLLAFLRYPLGPDWKGFRAAISGSRPAGQAQFHGLVAPRIDPGRKSPKPTTERAA